MLRLAGATLVEVFATSISAKECFVAFQCAWDETQQLFPSEALWLVIIICGAEGLLLGCLGKC